MIPERMSEWRAHHGGFVHGFVRVAIRPMVSTPSSKKQKLRTRRECLWGLYTASIDGITTGTVEDSSSSGYTQPTFCKLGFFFTIIFKNHASNHSHESMSLDMTLSLTGMVFDPLGRFKCPIKAQVSDQMTFDPRARKWILSIVKVVVDWQNWTGIFWSRWKLLKV